MNETTGTAPLGATAHEWQHFDLVLGLGADMLPVVCDPQAKPATGSKVKAFGKIPSAYDATGAHGISKWTTLEITPAMLDAWRGDPRLGLCVRSSAVRAIDVDITDTAAANAVRSAIFNTLETYGVYLPERERANSSKFLLPFRLSGAYPKRIINTEHGRIEFLADGQQFVVAGQHPSGARYQWLGGLPDSIPALTPEMFEELWTVLLQFGVSPADREGAAPSNEGAGSAGEYVKLAEIDDDTLADLREALRHPQLLDDAGANEVWSEVGYALLTLGKLGYTEFSEFSRRAKGFKEGDPERWWGEHHGQTHAARSDYRHIFTLARKRGWRSVASLDDFPPVESERRVAVEPGDAGVREGGVRESPFTLSPAARIEAAEQGSSPVPLASNRCTDQFNANRLSARFGHKLRAIAGHFYWYTGTHWQKDEGEAARCAARLSAIVGEEAQAERTRHEASLAAADTHTQKEWDEVSVIARKDQSRRATEFKALPGGADIFESFELADKLSKWRKQCEMQPTQAKALTLLRNLLTLDTAQLDSHPHLLNCQNGTVNLITGQLQPHNPADYITTVTPVAYNPDSPCPHFEQFLIDILDAERAQFLQRWFGHGITGDVREQKFALHIGAGGNGKSTLFMALMSAMGKGYFDNAAPNLFTGSSERHPTEVAALRGKRSVVSQESEDGSFMREALMKNLSGGEEITARYMYGDFFSFKPTFKLNLSTNYEPNIKGQDRGIWRRIFVVRYSQLYGSPADIAAGKATRLADLDLHEKLMSEREGILAWLVRGARDWYAYKLQPPASVINESDLYRSSQDRMQKFVNDKCVADPNAWSPFTNGPGALYPTYVQWCKDSGFMAMGLNKFGGELTRTMPGTRVEPRRISNRERSGVVGVRLDMGDLDTPGLFPQTLHGDLI